MPVSKLELTSSRGDQALPGVRFVLHGTKSATAAVSLREAGLDFAEGQTVATTNLAHALELAAGNDGQGLPGGAFVIAMPPNFHLGYAAFTSAYIDRQLKRVSGAPLRFAGGRNELAFYMSPDAESSRIHIESEVANGYGLDQRPQFLLDPQYVVGEMEKGPDLTAMLRQLEGMVVNLQPLDGDKLERSLVDLFRPSQPAHAVLGLTAMHGLVAGTVEALLMTRLRMMRWHGLALIGYRFYEGKEPVDITPHGDLVAQRTRMEDLERQVASSQIFAADLAWLKAYAIRQLSLMKIELDGAALEASDAADW